jgi:hypothetical protein
MSARCWITLAFILHLIGKGDCDERNGSRIGRFVSIRADDYKMPRAPDHPAGEVKP